MDNVWLVISESGAYDDFNSEITEICGSHGRAQITKMHIQDTISGVKAGYKDRHGSSYEDDLKFISDCSSTDIDTENYEQVVERVYTFQWENPVINVHTIRIEEREVKY